MINSIPQVQSDDRVQNQMQQNIVSPLNQLLKNPIVQGNFLTKALVVGVNSISHGLGRVMQGWIISDVNASVTIYRSAPMNASTLTLVSSGTATVSIYVF